MGSDPRRPQRVFAILSIVAIAPKEVRQTDGVFPGMRSSGLATKDLLAVCFYIWSLQVVVCAGGQAGSTACVQQMCINSQLDTLPVTLALRPNALPVWMWPHNKHQCRSVAL